MTSVSSDFLAEAEKQIPSEIIRRFIINGLTYTGFVTRWPTIKQKWDRIIPGNITIECANEESTFNLIRYSQAMTLWDAEQVTIDPNVELIASEHDAYVSDKVMETGSDSVHGIYNTNSDHTINGRYILSTYAKPAERSWLRLIMYNPDLPGGVNAFYNVASGTLGTINVTGSDYVDYIDHGLEDAPNGYKRIWLACDVTSASRIRVYQRLQTDDGQDSYLGTSGSGLYLWGSQLEYDPIGTRTVPNKVSITPARVYPGSLHPFNFLRAAPENLVNSASVDIGFRNLYVSSTAYEFASLFEGTIKDVVYSNGKCRITLTDKFQQLSNRVIGTAESPQDYTTSNHLVSDLAWYIITSHAGYSATKSSSNPDIDYDSFQEWSNVFSSDNVRMQALFDGQKCNEALRKIARLTDSAIYRRDNKIHFYRFNLAESYITDLDGSNTWDAQISISRYNLVNKQYVSGDYKPDSDYFAITVFDEDTPSVNTYGLQEEVEDDNVVWFVDSVSCLNAAQRITSVKANPYDSLDISGGLNLVTHEVGETITFKYGFYGIDDTYRIMERDIDLNTCEVTVSADKSQIKDAFTLDVSDLDGSDVLV